jgi:hexosaminidase
LEANDYSGIVRGLSTLIQLIKKASSDSSLYEIAHLPIVINDSPRYPFRGLMLDTARRYFSIDSIKEVIDAMSAAKFNVLHWHLVDDDSFPMVLDSYPDIAANGAFSSDRIYSKAMMADVVSYASKLAIRVIPEFDNPGHVRAVGLDPAFKDIVRCFGKDWANTVPNAYKIIGGPPTGVLDPSYDLTYELLTGILTDMDSIFPDSYVHLGGDEVFTSCFNENPDIINYMNENGIKDYSGLLIFYFAKVRDMLTGINSQKKAIYWSNEDTFYMRYQAGDILMYWGESSNIFTFKQSYPDNLIVFSLADYYYLDCGYGNKYGENTFCDPFKTWWTIY